MPNRGLSQNQTFKSGLEKGFDENVPAGYVTRLSGGVAEKL